MSKPKMTLKIKGSEDESFTINNSFEAECYFQKQAEKFQDRAKDALAVNVPEPSPIRELSVKPIEQLEEGGISVRDLSEEPILAVRTMESFTETQNPLSSFEALYDKTQLESVPGTVRLTAEELQESLGDRFKGTLQESAGGMSSFENIYQGGITDPLTEDFFITATTGTASDNGQAGDGVVGAGALPNVRWSAPANTIEPPIIESGDFATRFDAVQEQISDHWSDIKCLVETEQEAESRKSEEKGG